MHTSVMMAVNSPPAHRDLNGTASQLYRPYNDEISSMHIIERPAVPDQETERNKKDKKWSFGKLFRRKKKEEESSTSDTEDTSTRSPTKRKTKKKKKTPSIINNFDHIVIRDERRAQSLMKPCNKDITDDGVLSDPSISFGHYRPKVNRNSIYAGSKEAIMKDEISNRLGKPLEVNGKKVRRGRLKARVEALRNSMKGDSSSDEESLKSSNSSSILRFRSDDSLMRSRDSSLNKRTRTARNERHIKRLSRDDENQLNKEAELLQQGYTKAEVEMLTRTPTSQSSGYGTCKRDQKNRYKYDQIYANDISKRPLKSESVSSFPSTQSYPSSINFNAKVNNEQYSYSIHHPNNIANDPIYANNSRHKSVDSYDNSDIICVKFPLGNVNSLSQDEKSPPVPPPRDLQRKLATPISMNYENNKPNNVYGVPNNDFERVMRKSQDRSLNQTINGLRRPISSSEDHIAMQNKELYNSLHYKNDQPRRPASVSAEPNHALYVNSPPWKKNIERAHILRPEPIPPKQDYLYYADQSPRSRRPISIKTSQNGINNQYLSDSQSSILLNDNVQKRPRNASEFWKRMDDVERSRKQPNKLANSRSSNDCLTNNQNRRNGQYFERLSVDRPTITDIQNRNSCINGSYDTVDAPRMWQATTEYKRSSTVGPTENITSPTNKRNLRLKSETYFPNNSHILSDEDKQPERRKSTNLDDALNELEAIYNSLGLGDEDLLDRAERRELMTPKFDHLDNWNGNDQELQLRSQPTTPLRRVLRRSTLPDKLQDDMAFRRMNSKEKPKQSLKDAQSQISYMLTSPVYIPYASDDDRHSDRNEPDIVHDDVVYRNITQMNNRLKTLDPQPPFGIPVGPVAPAPQSDYLHAKPENKGRSRFVPRRSPDIVSDDLAYRSLRKDGRHSSLFNGDEFTSHINNNHNDYVLNKESVASYKKKRAIRSLSANIFTMIQKEIDDALNMSKMATLQKTPSNGDVTRQLRESFENNANEQESYPRNKVKQRHNTINIFVNNSHSPNHHFAKDDSCIHSDEKNFIKPPSHCDKSKSSSPSNRSPQTSKRSSKDEFQQVLTMLAQEAMDTSNKLGVALAELDKNRNNNERKSDIQARLTDSRINFLNGLTNGAQERLSGRSTPEIKHVNIHSEIINQPHTETAKKTEDSLLTISNQLHKVEDQLKHSIEKEINFEDESKRLSNYVPQCQQVLKAQETLVKPKEKKATSDVLPMSVRNDSIRIETINGPELKVDSRAKPVEIKSPEVIEHPEDKIKELNEIKAFKELKDGISDLIAGISQVNEKLFTSQNKSEEKETESETKADIKEANEKLTKLEESSFNKEKQTNRASLNLSIYEDDLQIKKENTDSTEYNSSEELATIFKSRPDDEIKPNSVTKTKPVEEPRNDLSSPKLVQNVNQHLRRLSVDVEDVPSSQNNALPTNIIPWRTKRQNNSQKDNRGNQSSRDSSTSSKNEWQSSRTLMLACTYTMMITQQLADVDWLLLLGLILAMITIVAMLLI